MASAESGLTTQEPTTEGLPVLPPTTAYTTAPATSTASTTTATTTAIATDVTSDEYDRMETVDWLQLTTRDSDDVNTAAAAASIEDFYDYSGFFDSSSTTDFNLDEFLETSTLSYDVTLTVSTPEVQESSLDRMYEKNAESFETKWLVGGLVLGCLLTAIVFVFVFKKCFDAYQKRHYRKLDYLINGMYN